MNRCTQPRTVSVIDQQPIAASSSPRASRLSAAVARSVAVLGIGACAIASTSASALELCANSALSLQTAITVAEFAQEPVTIKIAKGTYAMPGLSVAFPTRTTLLGGYDGACTERSANVRATDTVVDFGGYGVYIAQNDGNPVALFETDGLSLLNAWNLEIRAGDWGDEGSIHLARTRITGVSSGTEAIELNVWGGGSVRLENVLIDTLPAGMPSGQCALAPRLLEGGEIQLVNTTISLPANKNLCFDTFEEAAIASVYNSIIWSPIQTSAIDSHMTTVNTYNSTFALLNRNGGDGQDLGVSSSNPQWVQPGSGDYRLAPTSPAVNSGTVNVPGGLPSFDIDGKARWQGVLPDRGAYESPYQSAQTYTVTTTADSGAGSLRDAMTQANFNANLGVINFAIPGACPRVIALNTPLPKVTTPMLIDGTTQPGWIANTDDKAFLANLCVVVKPVSGTLAYAFNVPTAADASLKLRGVAMGGFAQPVFLAGGSGHVIAGNRFGGFLGSGLDLAGATLNSINVTPTMGNGGFIIGGTALADRNLISKSALSGIRIQAVVDGSQDRCQIINNLIGTSPSGNAAAPNFTGITVAGNHCLIDANRIVGNTSDAIVLEGAYDTRIQRNIIGLTANGNGLQNSGVGIRFAYAASGNTVGAPLSTYAWEFGNTIRFMADAGITVPDGTDNTIRSNRISDNGIDGDGLDIDLDADGTTANDVDVANGVGANHGQNFPVISQVTIPAGTPPNATNVLGSITAKLDSLPGTYRMDAYFSDQCGDSGRGHSDAYLGATSAGNLQVFTFAVVLPNVLPGRFVSFTATDQAGNTSEMGTCFPVIGAADTLFKHGFEMQ